MQFALYLKEEIRSSSTSSYFLHFCRLWNTSGYDINIQGELASSIPMLNNSILLSSYKIYPSPFFYLFDGVHDLLQFSSIVIPT